MKTAVCVVFLNEEPFLRGLLASLAVQTSPPWRIVLVDDGSTDGSLGVAQDFVGREPRASLVERAARPRERDRLESASVWRSFHIAVDGLGGDWDIVAKLDADLWLPPRLIEQIEGRFSADPKLGLAGPFLSEPGPKGALKRLRSRPEHVAGATKFYRRACYEDIFPLPYLLNLDMVDEAKARSRGWRTASFVPAGGDALHLRPHGTHDGARRAHRRWGRGDYASGTHPLLVAFVGLQRLREPPAVIGSMSYWTAWLLAAIRREPRFDAELRAFRRREQLARVSRRTRELIERRRVGAAFWRRRP